MNRVFGLDVLRAAAISMVIASHFSNGSRALGFFGVELFFVLSGFLIGSILFRSLYSKSTFNHSDLFQFLVRRWFRTIPNYLLFLFLYLLFTGNQLRTTTEFLPYIFFGQNLLWSCPSFFEVSWSLCVEEWFYILFAIAMYSWIAMFGVNRRSVLMVLGLFLIVPFIGRLIYSINGELDIRRIALLRLDAITIGVMVAFVKINYQRFWVRKRLFGLLSVSLLVTSIYLIQFGTPVHESIALLLVPISFGFLVPLAERISRPSKIFASSIETISILSYSIYLSHMLVYGGLKEVFGYGTMTNWERLIYKCFTLLVILGVSGFVYRYFEKPLTDVRDLFKTRRETSAVPENG